MEKISNKAAWISAICAVVKKDLFGLCKSELPEYAQPSDFVFVEGLPLTPIGKVDYRKLEELAAELD